MENVMKACVALAVLFFTPMWGAASGDYLGARECYSCHKKIKNTYLKEGHGKVFSKNPRNDLEAKSCEACHGPGGEHKTAMDVDEKGPLNIEFSFKKGADFTVANNKKCLTCHEKGNRTHWQGSSHDMDNVGCVDCHSIHSEGKIDGTEVCVKCHVQRRAQLQRSSHMPLREGKLKCTSCHNPHGSMGPTLLKQSSINEICYSCHSEKRGPLVWEHAPVRENCANCHDPHGSNYEALLKIKVPYLCLNCHMGSRHSGALYEGTDVVAGGGASQFVVGKACLNCHSRIHGSNHPSGSRFQR